jgi:hypothetical protein
MASASSHPTGHGSPLLFEGLLDSQGSIGQLAAYMVQLPGLKTAEILKPPAADRVETLLPHLPGTLQDEAQAGRSARFAESLLAGRDQPVQGFQVANIVDSSPMGFPAERRDRLAGLIGIAHTMDRLVGIV